MPDTKTHEESMPGLADALCKEATVKHVRLCEPYGL